MNLSGLTELVLEEKELGYCLIPMKDLRNEDEEYKIDLEDDEIAVYLPKLLNTLESKSVYEEEVVIDYSIVKNMKYKNKKAVECNYIIAKPYNQTNMSPSLFDVNEKCFIKFLYEDIKQPFFLYENINEKKTNKKGDRKEFYTEDIENGKSGISINTFDNIISLGFSFDKDDSKNSITINKEDKTIDIRNENSNILIEDDIINIKSNDIKLNGKVYLNDVLLEDYIKEIVEELIKDIKPCECE